MRIAIIIKSTTFHKNHGGMEVQNRILAEGLAERGNQVVVYSPKAEMQFMNKIDHKVLYRFVDSPYKNNNILQSIFNINVKGTWYNKSFHEFKKDHDASPYDVVISQSSAGLGIIRKKEELKIKVISIAHGTMMSDFKTLLNRPKTIISLLKIAKDYEYAIRTMLTRQKEFILKSDIVVAVSKHVKKNVILETGVEPENVQVIYNGVKEPELNLNLRNTYPAPILYVGRVEEDKGLFELIRLFNKVTETTKYDLKLAIVGEGTATQRLKDLAESLKCQDKVVFAGYLNGDALLEYYAKARIFVLPTKRIEGFPVTLPEAMFAGLPIVAMDMGGVREGVFDSETGYLINAGDFETFEKKVELLVKDADLRQTLGENSRKKARSLFSEAKMIDSYLELIVRL